MAARGPMQGSKAVSPGTQEGIVIDEQCLLWAPRGRWRLELFWCSPSGSGSHGEPEAGDGMGSGLGATAALSGTQDVTSGKSLLSIPACHKNATCPGGYEDSEYNVCAQM